MEPLAKVVCAVDASPASAAALRGAAFLSRKLGAELILLHVRPKTQAGEPVFAPPSAKTAPVHPPVEGLSGVASELRGQSVPLRVVSGDPAEEILAFVQRAEADVLVVGTHARSRLTLALGSVAGKVLARATCPVLVVQAP